MLAIAFMASWKVETARSLEFTGYQLNRLGEVLGQWQTLLQTKGRGPQKNNTWVCPPRNNNQGCSLKSTDMGMCAHAHTRVEEMEKREVRRKKTKHPNESIRALLAGCPWGWSEGLLLQWLICRISNHRKEKFISRKHSPELFSLLFSSHPHTLLFNTKFSSPTSQLGFPSQGPSCSLLSKTTSRGQSERTRMVWACLASGKASAMDSTVGVSIAQQATTYLHTSFPCFLVFPSPKGTSCFQLPVQ